MIDMKKSNQRGFSLIEILIAITVFAIGILAVGKMQITAIKGNSFANDLTEATTLAQDRMEKLIGLPYTDIEDTNATNGRYNISWNITTDHPIDNTKTIRVNVGWTDRGAPKEVSITSMKADII
jgi:type IV pilus modification protein PilV